MGSTPYAQYDLLGGDGSGMTSQVLSDNWQRTPGMGQGPIIGTSSWPPGKTSRPPPDSAVLFDS